MQEGHAGCAGWLLWRSEPCRGLPALSGRPAWPKPVPRAAITSEWSPKMDRAWAATERAETWKTAGVSSPAILYMLGIINSKPCEAVKVVVRAPVGSAPCTAPAAPPSACISVTLGTVPQMLGALCCPGISMLAHRRGGGNRVNGDDFVQPVSRISYGLVSINCYLFSIHVLHSVNNDSLKAVIACQICCLYN